MGRRQLPSVSLHYCSFLSLPWFCSLYPSSAGTCRQTGIFSMQAPLYNHIRLDGTLGLGWVYASWDFECVTTSTDFDMFTNNVVWGRMVRCWLRWRLRRGLNWRDWREMFAKPACTFKASTLPTSTYLSTLLPTQCVRWSFDIHYVCDQTPQIVP